MLRSISKLTASDAASRNVLTVPPSASLSKAIGMMSRFEVGSLLVAPRGELHEACGIITERDIVAKHDLMFDSTTTSATVEQLMSKDLRVTDSRRPLASCLRDMLEADIRHLPVIGMGGKVDALLSMRDLMAAMVQNSEGATEGARGAQPVDGGARLSDVIAAGSRKLGQEVPFVAQVPRESSVADAVLEMREKRTGSVLVPLLLPSSAATAFGIFTERDFLHVLASGAADARYASVVEHVTGAAELVWAEPDYPLLHALSLLTRERFRHLPVVSEGGAGSTSSGSLLPPQLAAVLSMREMLAFVATESE